MCEALGKAVGPLQTYIFSASACAVRVRGECSGWSTGVFCLVFFFALS